MAPKKCIVSGNYKSQLNRKHNETWCRRNDSSHMSDLLCLGSESDLCSCDDSDGEEPRTLTIFSKTNPPPIIVRHICPSCYCNQPPNPSILEKMCNCHEQAEYRQQSVFLKHSPRCQERPITRPCVLDHQLRQIRNVSELRNELNKMEKDMTLKEFRDEHYFECHSSNVDDKPNSAHDCVHPFNLNDNMKLAARNCDAFGTSRCTLCERPLSQTDLPKHMSLEHMLATPQPPLKEADSLKSVPSLPNDVGNLNCSVQVDTVQRKTKKFVKKAVPRDSLALRYQKGVYK